MLALLLLLLGVPDSRTDTLDLGAGVGLELVLVEHGSFQQGSPNSEPGRAADETLHSVSIGKDFYLGRTPVTRGQFARFVAETGYRTEAEKGSSGGSGLEGGVLVQRKDFNWRSPGFPQSDDHPVVLVSWEDAIAFVRWLGSRTGRSVSLPTEARFEFAARAGGGTRFPTGDSDAEGLQGGWFKPGAGDGTKSVGGKKPNRLGLLDMTGLVYQWCQDWYGPYPPGPLEDPVPTSSAGSDKPRRVLRGGSFLKQPKDGRSAARYRNTPGSRNADNGFRVMVEMAVPAAAAPASNAPAVTRPLSVPPRQSQGDSWVAVLLGLLCLGGGGAGVLGVAWLLRRLLTKSEPKSALNTRLADDGFWLEVPADLSGSTINYSCQVRGVEHLGSLTGEPGPQGQFVYTGGRPSQVRILPLLAAASQAPLLAAPPPRTPPVRHQDPILPDDHHRFRGYPSAY